MSESRELIHFLKPGGGIDFTAPVPVQFLEFEFPIHHDPDEYIEYFRLSCNWTVRLRAHEETAKEGVLHPHGFQLYHKGKELSILTPTERPELEWELFRRGDIMFRVEEYSVLKQCVRDRHAVRMPPWCVIERFVRQFCPWCAGYRS